MDYSSKILEQAVEEISTLPGIGKRTAMRLALHLLKKPENQVFQLTKSINELVSTIKRCKICHNLSDHDICDICSSESRNAKIICVVEDIRDIIAIERTHNYYGVYHVLDGKISPMDGVGPNDLNIETLISRLQNDEVNEIVFALSSTMEGDTTMFYLYRKIKEFDVKISTIARGVAIGDELQYTDQLTLGKSLENRIPYESTLK